MRKKMTKKEMATFAAGDLFGGGAQLVIAFFYLRFLTDVVRISPILAGTVVLLSKIWDAISDPLMGCISDNTRTRYGRRKPYLLSGFFLIIISFTLLWYAPNFTSQGAKFAFVVFSYLFFSTVSTIVMVPYTAFSSEISLDTKERDTVNGSRLFFSQLSSLIGAVLPMIIVGMLPEKTGYLMMGLIFSIFYAIPFLGIFLICKERVPMPKDKTKFNIKKMLSPFKIRTYRYLIGIYLSAFFVMDVVSAVFSYYMTYFIQREDLLELVLGTMLITQIAALPLVMIISNKIGKAKTFILGSSIFILGSSMLGIYNSSWHISAVFIIAGVVGLGLIGCIVIPWIMYPDVADISVLAFGERRSGSFAGFMTFMRKFSSAIGIWVVGLMLQISGYIAPGDIIAPIDSIVSINESQEVVIDLGKNGTNEILINLESNKIVKNTDIIMNHDISEDVFFIDINKDNSYDVVVEKELKVSKAYDFSTESTVKSINNLNQPSSFIIGLRVIVFVLPVGLLLLAIVLAYRYPLTKKYHEKLLHFIKIKNGEIDEYMSIEEIEHLKKLLIRKHKEEKECSI